MNIPAFLERLQELTQAILSSMEKEDAIARETMNIRQARRDFINSIDFTALAKIRGVIPQKAIARRADVSQTTISFIENGDVSGVSIDVLERILTVYHSLNKSSQSNRPVHMS